MTGDVPWCRCIPRFLWSRLCVGQTCSDQSNSLWLAANSGQNGGFSPTPSLQGCCFRHLLKHCSAAVSAPGHVSGLSETLWSGVRSLSETSVDGVCEGLGIFTLVFHSLVSPHHVTDCSLPPPPPLASVSLGG